VADSAGLARSVSIVLPVHNQADQIGDLVVGYLDVVARLRIDVELVLVTNACTDRSVSVCRGLARRHREVTLLEQSAGGWGRAVRAGLTSARGDLLCYTNSARTAPETLALMLSYARVYPNVVIKANRRIRDNIVRRVGSLFYNLECRALFDIPTWDVNGTPKLFPRAFHELLKLSSTGDLIDAEFILACQEQSYPIIEVPLLATTRLGGRSTTNYRSAVRMYRGVIGLRRRVGSMRGRGTVGIGTDFRSGWSSEPRTVARNPLLNHAIDHDNGRVAQATATR
jgi:glycosyltransferase involved in cell wall biosynthesis